MKKTYSFYYMLAVIISLNFLMYCEGGNGKEAIGSEDSTQLNHEDTLSNTHRDPSSAYPLPPVTGTTVDSSYIKDSLAKKDSSNQ